MLTDPQTYEPSTCAHDLTRDEGCIPCEATSFASDEDGTIDHALADAFEAWAVEAQRAEEVLAAIKEMAAEQELMGTGWPAVWTVVADYPHEDGLF